MDNNNDLWQGGPWEQPAPPVPELPAVSIPGRARSEERPLLRPKRKRRLWPWFLGLFSLILTLTLGVVLLRYAVDSMIRDSGRDLMPYIDGDRRPQETDYSTEPPSIPRAEVDDPLILELQPPRGEPLSYGEIYEKALPSTVSIQCLLPDGYGAGSGVVLTDDGYILTNAHVVAGARKVEVVLHDNRIFTAELVGFHAAEDLAVLKIEADGLTPAQLGDSFALRIGDDVAALGDSLGYRSTLTNGIVSALDREVEVEGITMVLIQTNAAINFGNSGGPLLNQYGQVVGINTVKIVTDDGSAESMGFAIPSQRVKYVVEKLAAGEEVRTGMFGFTVLTTPTPEGGLQLDSVETFSDAWAKGLRAGDIILAADGRPVRSAQDLTQVKLRLGPGDLVTLTCLRNGEEFTVEVALVDAQTHK